jgi:hypothetical protein
VLSTLLAQYGQWLLLVGAVLCAFAIFKATRAGLQSRNAAYYALRQEAIARLRRWALIATIVLIAIGTLAFVINTQPPPQSIARRTPTSTPIVYTATPKPKPSLTPTAPVTLSPSPTSTSTPQPTKTSTATATLRPGSVPNALLTPIPSSVPPAPNAKLIYTALASVLDNNGNPVDAGAKFPQGTRSVKIFFRANNVDNNVVWSVFCYKGNRLVDSFIDVWKWGTKPQGGRAFCAIDGSLGAYRVTGYLGLTKQFEAPFTVVVPPTATPPIALTTTTQP